MKIDKFCYSFIFIITIFCLHEAKNAYSQTSVPVAPLDFPSNQWIYEYSLTSDSLRVLSVDNLKRREYVFAGDLRGAAYPHRPGLVFKSDRNGNVIWQKEFGCNSVFQSVRSTSDGGFVAAGWKGDLCSGFVGNGLAVKFSNTGAVLWQKTYGGINNDYLYSIKQTSDGGFVATGFSSSFNPSSFLDVWVIRLDALGNILWSRTYGDVNIDWGTDIEQTTDNYFLVSAINSTLISPLVETARVLKLDNIGNLVWDNKYGGTPSAAYSITEVSDGKYVFVGYSNVAGAGWNYMVVKLNTDGTVNWQKGYGGVSTDIGYSIAESLDGNYLIAGDSSIVPTEPKVWVLKLRTDGSVIWQKSYGDNFPYRYISRYMSHMIIATKDTGAIVVSNLDWLTPRAWVFKFDSNGDVGTGCNLVIPTSGLVSNLVYSSIGSVVVTQSNAVTVSNLSFTTLNVVINSNLRCY